MGLRATVRRLVWRMRAAAFLRYLVASLLCSLCISILVAGFDRLIYFGPGAVVAVAALAVAAMPAAAVLVWVEGRPRARPAAVHAAICADRSLGLGDRLASALELGPADGPWAEAVVTDADRCSAEVLAADVFPLRPTLCARLLVPAAIVLGIVFMLPRADLLGRMRRAVEQSVAEQVIAERKDRAIAAAASGMGAGSWPGLGEGESPQTAGALRVALVKIRQDLLSGMLDDATRLDLGERLRRLAALAEAQGADRRLADAVRNTALALSRGDEEAARALRAAAEELARLEKALAGSDLMDKGLREWAEREQTALEAARLSPSTDARGPQGAGMPEDGLVEVTAVAKKPPESDAPSGGIIYSGHAMGEAVGRAVGDYESAARAARAQIESGEIPPRYIRLVRDYFDAIKPAARRDASGARR